jgi:predicted nucleic acid-binding protein
VNVNDLWIAASAVAHGLPIVTQDDDFDSLDGVRGLVVVRV